MRVRVLLLNDRIDLRWILRADGWTLESGGPDSVVAAHPNAADASAIRGRLFRLGLLTSHGVRIEFLPSLATQQM
jgi:hypothetical protein